MAPVKRTHSGTAKDAAHDVKPSADAEPSHVDTSERPKRPEPGVGADTYFHNLYRAELDFRQLAREDPACAKLYAEPHPIPHPFYAPTQRQGWLTHDPRLKQGHLDFTDPAAVVQLTKTLLKTDYGLEIDLPPDRLCPPVSFPRPRTVKI